MCVCVCVCVCVCACVCMHVRVCVHVHVCVCSILLYGSQMWTLYRRNIQDLENLPLLSTSNLENSLVRKSGKDRSFAKS